MSKELTFEKLPLIKNFILQGLNEKEACIMADVSYTDFLDKKEKIESTRIYFEKAEIEFKLTHIQQIQRGRSDKNSMYLLEKLRPEEFGNKKTNEAPTQNIINLIVKSIQNDNNQSIVIRNRQQKFEDDSSTILLEPNQVLS